MTLTDPLTPATRSALMARIRRADTKPEMIVRRMLHAARSHFRAAGRITGGVSAFRMSGSRLMREASMTPTKAVTR